MVKSDSEVTITPTIIKGEVCIYLSLTMEKEDANNTICPKLKKGQKDQWITIRKDILQIDTNYYVIVEA